MKKKMILMALIVMSVFFVTACGGNQNINEDEFEDYQQLLSEYYEAYQAGDFDTAIGYFTNDFDYEESGQTYKGEEVLRAAIDKNQHLRHRFTVRHMENMGNGILVTLDNSSYLLDISGIDSYESQEFFTFKRDKIDSVTVKIDEDDYLYITKMIEADPRIIFYESDNQIMIAEVAADSEAAEKGLEPEARLLAIDDVPVSEFELGANEAVYRVAGIRDSEVTITVEQNEQVLEMTLQRKLR